MMSSNLSLLNFLCVLLSLFLFLSLFASLFSLFPSFFYTSICTNPSSLSFPPFILYIIRYSLLSFPNFLPPSNPLPPPSFFPSYDRSCSQHPPPLSRGVAPPLSLALPRSLASEDSRQTLHSTSSSFTDRER